MEDVAPKLWEELRTDYLNNKKSDARIQRFLSQVENGTAVSEDAARYAMFVGEAAAKALKKVLALERLPDKRLYFNIAERTVRPLLELVHEDINEVGMKVMDTENAKKGIRLKVPKGEFPEERVKGFIDKLIELSTADENDES